MGINYSRYANFYHQSDHHRLVDLLYTIDEREINIIIKSFAEYSYKNNLNLILLSSEKFTELLMRDYHKFLYFCKELKKYFELTILFVKRDINRIVDSGLRHILHIINKENVFYFSNFFGFKLNVVNFHFDIEEVRACITDWILKAYNKIQDISFNTIEVKYDKDIIFEILSNIPYIEKDHIRIESENFNEKHNTYSISDHEDYLFYLEYLNKIYLSSEKREIVNYFDFKNILGK